MTLNLFTLLSQSDLWSQNEGISSVVNHDKRQVWHSSISVAEITAMTYSQTQLAVRCLSLYEVTYPVPGTSKARPPANRE